MAINEDKSWDEVGAIATDSSGGKVKNAFLHQKADKVLLETGTILYKFNDFPTLGRGTPGTPEYEAQTISPWWSPYNAFRHDAGWEQKKRLAGLLGVSIRELGRVTSAIKENWNSNSYLLVITLKTDVYGFFGGFTQMARIDAGGASKVAAGEGKGKTKNLPGGATQFYIPNLHPSEVSFRTESLLGK